MENHKKAEVDRLTDAQLLKVTIDFKINDNIG